MVYIFKVMYTFIQTYEAEHYPIFIYSFHREINLIQKLKHRCFKARDQITQLATGKSKVWTQEVWLQKLPVLLIVCEIQPPELGEGQATSDSDHHLGKQTILTHSDILKCWDYTFHLVVLKYLQTLQTCSTFREDPD